MVPRFFPYPIILNLVTMIVRTLRLNKIKILIIFFSLLFICSCVEEFYIEIKKEQDNSLVVEGKITNKPGPYTVKLSTASSFEYQEIIPFSEAIVQIIDNEGNSENLLEVEPGVYTTSETGIQGVVGRSYKIIIQTKTGNNYESGFEELLKPVGAESVSFKRESRLVQNLLTDYEDGFQFYISTETSAHTNNYYSWELEETYEIRSEWEIVLIYNGHNYGSDYGDQRNFRPSSARDTLFYCWNTRMRDKKFTNSTTQFNIPKINNSPLHFISFTDEKLKYKYSLLVKQLTISENTYKYLNALYDQEGSQEGLYATQPYKIQGNVFNNNNPDEVVLGYFKVASISEAPRITVTPPTRTKKWHSNCIIYFDEPGINANFYDIDRRYSYLPDSWPIYITKLHVPETERDSMYILPRQSCVDCTKRGGTTQKPDYWDQ